MALTTEDVLTLARAGFTAEQIAKMGGASPDPAPAPVPADPEPAPAPADPEPAPAPAPEPAAAPAASTDNREILQALKDLTSAIQMGNIRQNGPGPQGPETVEQVLASIINP